jgi:biopolymer transport protein ExbD
MIDVVFLLLFFFLVVSRFGAEGMLPARLPTAAASVLTEIPRTPIRIFFGEQRDDADQAQITIERFELQPIPINVLTGSLSVIRDEQPGFGTDTPVHLIADDNVPWQDIVNAYNACLAAGYRKVFFVDS